MLFVVHQSAKSRRKRHFHQANEPPLRYNGKNDPRIHRFARSGYNFSESPIVKQKNVVVHTITTPSVAPECACAISESYPKRAVRHHLPLLVPASSGA